MKKVGVLGGGQLGMMLLESIFRLGGRAAVYDPDPDAPASQHVRTSFTNTWTDLKSLEEFFELCDVVTYEFENVESGCLVGFEQKKPILPSVRVLLTTQDRIFEKRFMKENDLPHVYFAEVEQATELDKAAHEFGFPSIIKRARGGYDGKGQYRFESYQDFKAALDNPDSTWPLTFSGIIEEIVDLQAEVSCIVARSKTGQEIAFPVCQNLHTNHILDMTILPATIAESVQNKVQQIALHAARTMGVYGLLTSEFFLTRTPAPRGKAVECDGWYIYVNEFAPRPHNSGHVTRNACCLSQYDALARILLDMPLSQPWVVAPGYFCMGNLLGEVFIAQNGEQKQEASLDLSCIAEHPNVIDIVLYGKKEARVGRKMGHFVTYGDTPEKATTAAEAFRQALSQETKKSSRKPSASGATSQKL